MRAPSLLICTLMALCVVGIGSSSFAAITEVVISAETIRDFGETSPQNTAFVQDADASNGLAFQFIGGANFSLVANPTAWWEVEFWCEAGTYHIWARGKSDGNVGTDSFWLQFDDQIGTTDHTADPDFTFRGLGNWRDVVDAGIYKWLSQGTPPLTVVEWKAKESGLHRVRAQPRQHPHFLDQLLLSQDQDEQPDDDPWPTEFPRKDPRAMETLATTWDALKDVGNLSSLVDTQLSLPEGAKARLGKGGIGDLQYSPDGTRLAVAGGIGIWLYDTATHQVENSRNGEVALLTGHTDRVNSVAYSPDGNTIASGSGGYDVTVRLWDAKTGQQKATLRGHAGNVYSVAFSPDGDTLASGSGDVRLWDADTGQHKATLTGHTGSVRSVAFSPDGDTIASGSYDNTIRLWDADTGQEKATLTGHTGRVESVAFSPDGNTIASSGGYGDNTVRLWDAKTGQHKDTLTGHTAYVYSVAFSPDGETLASGGWQEVRLWDANTGQHKANLEHPEWVNNVTFSPDGNTIASGGGYGDNTVRLWDAKTGQHETTITGHTGLVRSVAFSPDGDTIASSGGYRDNTVRLWDAKTGQEKAALTGHTRDVWSVAFSPDGETLASGGYGETRLWDAVTGQHKATLTGAGYVYSVAFSPDGNTLASGGHYGDNTVRLWDAKTGQHKATLTGHTDTIWSVAFSPDGATLASGGGDSTVRLWDAVTGQHKATFTGHTYSVWSVSFRPDGATLASGGGDSTVRLWDAVTGQHKATFTGHTGYVFSVAFSPDGNTLASGSYNGTVRLWDANTGQHKATLTGHTGRVNSVSFSPDGNTLASGSSDGTVLLWEITPSAPTEPPQPKADVNGDNVVNILDLVLVGSNFGKTGQNDADINGDGVVNIVDLVLVAGALGNAAAAPSAHPQALAMLTAADVEGWLTQAQQMALTDPAYQRGIAMLKQLLAAMTPAETVLLPNYPNPFNPETWIPYHLAHAADVTLTIYDTKGAPVRQLDLGHQPAGYYTDRTKAAYWDGRNDSGEQVASGVYFYHLRVGDYAATRRMVIVK